MKPTTARVLRTLQDAGPRGATTAELCQPDCGGVRFAARVHELRHLHGHTIVETRVRQGSSRYMLTGSAAGPCSPSLVGAASRRSGETPRRVVAPEPYTEPPDDAHEWALVWDFDRASPNCGCSYWERPTQKQMVLS